MGDTKHFTDFSIISLGSRCWSRTLWNSFNLVNTETRKWRMPFDGCITSYKSLLSLLDNDFDNVFSKLRKSVTGKIFLTEFQNFQHEKTDDLENFKEQEHFRIKQFYDEINFHIKEKKTLVFFLTYARYPRKLISLLKDKFPKLKFKIFCISIWPSKKQEKSINDEFCYFTRMEVPSAKKAENIIHFGKTTEGQVFEKKVLEELLNFLTELSGVPYDLDEIFSARKDIS
jgi:hypothetical protein